MRIWVSVASLINLIALELFSGKDCEVKNMRIWVSAAVVINAIALGLLALSTYIPGLWV